MMSRDKEKILIDVWNEFAAKFSEPEKISTKEDLLYQIKVSIYKYFTEYLQDEFEPTEFFELLLNLYLITYPKQEEFPVSLQRVKFLHDHKDKHRPAALKAYLHSLNLNNKQLFYLLDAFLIFLRGAEKEDREFAFSRIFIEAELEKIKKGLELVPEQSDVESSDTDEDPELLRNTIEDYLEPFKNEFRSEKHYLKAVEAIKGFFEGKQSKVSEPIFIRNGNKTKLAKELGKLYQIQENKPLSRKYLIFLTKIFSVFANEKLEKKEFTKTNMYKYCTTKNKY